MFKKKNEKNSSDTAISPVWRDGHLKMEPWAIVPTENPLRVHIRAVKENFSIIPADIPAEGYKETKLEAALQAVKEVKKIYPDAEISIEVEV